MAKGQLLEKICIEHEEIGRVTLDQDRGVGGMTGQESMQREGSNVGTSPCGGSEFGRTFARNKDIDVADNFSFGDEGVTVLEGVQGRGSQEALQISRVEGKLVRPGGRRGKAVGDLREQIPPLGGRKGGGRR